MDVREEFWNELEDFLPDMLFDAHTHVSYGNTELPGGGGIRKGEAFGIETLLSWDSELYPGREMSYSLIGMPLKEIDVYKMADYTIYESQKYRNAYPVIVVKPGIDEKRLEKYIEEKNVIGFKPYRYYSVTGDIDECRITDFLPENIVKIANRYGLLIVLHLSKRNGALDKDNKHDLMYLSEKYPNVKWQLAHCARSFNPYFLEGAIGYLSELENIYFDTSAVCESDVFNILLSNIDISRILFGSDNIPVHIEGGKYISYGHAWMFLSGKSCNLELTHCDPDTVPVVYEELIALKRAMTQVFGLQKARFKEAVNKIFYEDAYRLVGDILKARGMDR